MKMIQVRKTPGVKYLILLTILMAKNLIGQPATIQKQLTALPLGIELGITNISKLESQGVLISGFNSSDSARKFLTRCKINKNQFYAFINLSNVVDRISFQSISQHQLPKNWKNTGLRLARRYKYAKEKRDFKNKIVSSEKESGNTIAEFMHIISEAKARGISHKITYQSDNQTEETITFELGNYLFVAVFVKWSKPYWCKNCTEYTDYDNGLVTLDISLL